MIKVQKIDQTILKRFDYLINVLHNAEVKNLNNILKLKYNPMTSITYP
jgi:hypothetical protein